MISISSGLNQSSRSSAAIGEMALVLVLAAVGVAGLNATDAYRIGAVFPSKNLSGWSRVFLEATSRINEDGNRSVRVDGFTFPVLDSPPSVLHYACEAIADGNVSVIVAFGGQDLLNLMTVIARYARLPLIAYNTEGTPVYTKGDRPMFLQLDPAKSLMALALVQILTANEWFYVSLIIEESYNDDGFVDAFLRLTRNASLWQVEDRITVAHRSSQSTVDSQLLNLLENQSRVVVLHCGARMAKTVFQVAASNDFVRGYAWFVTEDVVRNQRNLLDAFPVGLIAVRIGGVLAPDSLVPDTVRLIANGLEQFRERMATIRSSARSTPSVVVSTDNFCSPASKDTDEAGELLYRILKNTTVRTTRGNLSFDANGVRSSVHELQVLNLVLNDRSRKVWRTVASFRSGALRFSTIVWPGNTVSGPPAKGQRTLRVVTIIAEPFVMEQATAAGKCLTTVPCLRVNSKNKEVLDDIFKDFEGNRVNESASYSVSCCRGLAVMLLERLARDLHFNIQLYITPDNRFGSFEDGRWNGMVEDLLLDSAHMAVSAFSATKARSQAIDFTYPFFYSGYAILVAERRRSPPIYAFMEPFDGWVWISIVCSATVVAVALSMLEWNSPFGLNPWGRKRKTNYTLGSGLNMVYAILFQHTIKTKSPKAWPSKWLQNFWAGASIFIYSSYTANLAAFLAGKNSDVIITGLDDPALLEPGTRIAIHAGTAVEDFTAKVNPRLLKAAERFRSNLSSEIALGLLLNSQIDAYIDDTPILEYARTNLDAKCQLQLVGRGFGEDAYAIGLRKNSWLNELLTNKILEYHESGFMDDLRDMFFRRSKCNDQSNDGQLQGEALSMDFDQHAGLYLLLVVGIVACVVLMLVEHATFKWMVPYWRLKPTNSFWKSPSMLFWSQRLHRIITSVQLVSPHHSAREMIEVMKKRDFAKLFQKSVRRQENRARNRKNLFSVVEQLKWKATPSLNVSGRKRGPACDLSTESPQDAKVDSSPDKPECNTELTKSSEEAVGLASSDRVKCTTPVGSVKPLRSSLKLDIDRTVVPRPRNFWGRTSRYRHSTIDENDRPGPAEKGPTPPSTADRPSSFVKQPFFDDRRRRSRSSGLKTSLSWSSGTLKLKQDLEFTTKRTENRRVSMDDSITIPTTTTTTTTTPPLATDLRLLVAGRSNGFPFAKRRTFRKRTSLRPVHQSVFLTSPPAINSNWKKHDAIDRKTSLPVRASSRSEIDKTAAADEVRSALSRRKTVDVPRPALERQTRSAYRNPGKDMSRTLQCLSKEELLYMWKASEKALNRRLKEALKRTEELQARISCTEG